MVLTRCSGLWTLAALSLSVVAVSTCSAAVQHGADDIAVERKADAAPLRLERNDAATIAPSAAPAPHPVDTASIELERSHVPGDTVADPFGAWQVAIRAVPDGGLVRGISFARHGMFVFHSAPRSDAVEGNFVGWHDGAYEIKPGESRDPALFKAAGVDPRNVSPALQRLMSSEQWRRHTPLDSFFLQSFRSPMFWRLMPVPTGGFVEGVAVPTYDVDRGGGQQQTLR